MNKWHKPTRKELDKAFNSFFTVFIIGIIAIASLFYGIVLTNSEALKALIGTEATVIGFFGIVAVYWLTSLDTRVDRLEQEKHEYKMKKTLDESTYAESHKEHEITSLEIRINKILAEKQKVANRASIVGAMIVIS